MNTVIGNNSDMTRKEKILQRQTIIEIREEEKRKKKKVRFEEMLPVFDEEETVKIDFSKMSELDYGSSFDIDRKELKESTKAVFFEREKKPSGDDKVVDKVRKTAWGSVDIIKTSLTSIMNQECGSKRPDKSDFEKARKEFNKEQKNIDLRYVECCKHALKIDGSWDISRCPYYKQGKKCGFAHSTEQFREARLRVKCKRDKGTANCSFIKCSFLHSVWDPELLCFRTETPYEYKIRVGYNIGTVFYKNNKHIKLTKKVKSNNVKKKVSSENPGQFKKTSFAEAFDSESDAESDEE